MIVNVDFDELLALAQLQELYQNIQFLEHLALVGVNQTRVPAYNGLIIGGNFDENDQAYITPPAHQGRYAFEPLDKENEVEIARGGGGASKAHRTIFVNYTYNAHFLINIATPTIASVFNTEAVHLAVLGGLASLGRRASKTLNRPAFTQKFSNSNSTESITRLYWAREIGNLTLNDGNTTNVPINAVIEPAP